MAQRRDNPFRIGEHVTGAFFTDRVEEVHRIHRGLVEPSRLLVYGPRRMGKSSAIAMAAARAREDGGLVVQADLSTATTVLDVSARLLRSLYRETRSLRLRVEELLGGLEPRVSFTPGDAGTPPGISFGVERRTGSAGDHRRSLEGVIERLAAVRGDEDRPLAVVLDEFQAVRELGGEAGEWHLRDVIQRHGGLSFICAGSQESLIREMIGPKAAFHKMFEHLHVGPIEAEHLARWIEDRLRSGVAVRDGVGREILDRAGPRTQDVVQVARQLYFRGLSGGSPVGRADVAAALDDVVRHEEPIVRSLWNELSAHQQDVLRVVALGAEQLFSAEVRDRYGLPAASSIQRAVQALVRRGLLVRDGSRISFDSPFVRRWVRREVAPDLG